MKALQLRQLNIHSIWIVFAMRGDVRECLHRRGGRSRRAGGPRLRRWSLARRRCEDKSCAATKAGFVAPGDAANLGWVHWSRNANRIAPETLTFEMWPDVSELGPNERFRRSGFHASDGSQAELFSSDNAATVRRHFEWMRDYGLDGAWLQRFVVGLPGGPVEITFPSNRRVLQHVRDAAQQTGRVWAISYDIAAMPTERIYDTLTHDWKKLVDEQVTADPRYANTHEPCHPPC